MKTLEIIGFKRANLDSAALNEIRDAGNVPCVVYGPGIPDQVHFYSPAILFRDLIYTPDVHLVELNIEGRIIKAVLKEAQFHPVSEVLLHADFMAYTDTKVIKFEIPVKVEGSSPGIAKGGKLEFKTRKLKVKGLAQTLPDFVTIGVPRALRGKKGE
jgi:large subunit ribosomal protein L25